jgi:hypothetical protein
VPTTSSSGLRYPASSAAPNVPADLQNLATDLDTKVVVPVANTTARNALTKYDGMKVYEQSSKRTFRWNATTSKWDFESGPVYTWTPTLIDSGNAPVTGVTSASGEYVIVNGNIRFRADIVFGGSIDGRTGNLRLQLPAGVVGRTTPSTGSQGGMTCRLYTAIPSVTWSGLGHLAPGGTKADIMFPVNSSTTYMSGFTNATSAGATGTGTPLISGSYPLTPGSEFCAWGEFSLSAWSAL